MEQKYIDRIEELRHHTYSRIQSLQKDLCPMIRRNIHMNYQFDYWYDGYNYNIWESDTHLYAVKEIPYCYDNVIGNTTFKDTLDVLVDEDKVWPFILFINGEAIPWSNITIIHDYNYSYMKIENYDFPLSLYADMLVFPIGSKHIRYGEDSDIITDPTNRKGFYFDSSGARISDVEFSDDIAIRLEILDDDIYYKEVNVKNIQGDVLEFKDLPDGFVPSLDNIILFSDRGFLIPNVPDYLSDAFDGALGKFKIKGVWDAGTAVLMYNIAHSKMLSSLYNRLDDLNRDNISDILNSNGDPSSDVWNDLIERLVAPFDFEYEPGVDYDTNVNNAFEYIMNYDHRLFKDTVSEDSNMQDFTYTGEEYKSKADETGYVNFSKKHTDYIQDTVMVFVNSKLYKHSDKIVYSNGTIKIPTEEINDDDHVEIVLFERCNNMPMSLTVEDSADDIELHPSIDLDDSYIMSEECSDPEYDVPDSVEHKKQYIVDFTYEKTEDEKYHIFFEDPFYYGKDLKIISKKQFKYYRFDTGSEGQYKIDLPNDFNYCHDVNKYLIFVNGKKIDKTEYTITIMNKYRPFHKLVLYLSTILDLGDYVDIFYVPMNIEEKYKLDSIDKSGLLRLTPDTGYTKYPFSKNTVMVFVNGYKVNPLEIKDVSDDQILILVDKYKRDENGQRIDDGHGGYETIPNAIPSIYNVTVAEYITENIIEDKDSWSNYIDEIEDKGYGLQSIYGPYYDIEDEDIEESYKIYYGGLKSVLYDIVIDYYLIRQEVETGSPFIYDFEIQEWEPFNDTDTQNDEDVIIITVYPDHDKLLDYELIEANIADTSKVIQGIPFYMIE